VKYLSYDESDWNAFEDQKRDHELVCERCNTGKFCSQKPTWFKRRPNRKERALLMKERKTSYGKEL